MFDFLTDYQKNFWKMIMIPAFSSTIEMVVITTVLATVFAFMISVILLVTNKDGIHPNKVIYQIIAFIINVIRSFPFVILMVFLLPFTKAITGTSFGVKAALVPLTVSATAFITRLIENAMKEVDPDLIEAMRSFGISDFQVIFNVMLSEAFPAIISGIILATIAILGSSAMAGVMGAGGIGAVAITYGYQSFNDNVMYLTAAILVVMVQGIQSIGDWIYRKMK
ncbi:ABC-type metal ion transport system, permease component [Desulfosporosinus orientis DSM 765]|uniref:ABC-type metal ion transport system, permease component n=1 Tax=Desulfosporosinus orientis (strain ATCC 19365 / DSM 765 / NCIMB 8382 / VKM B-1628 / Singapore I) TaxID=768706 RepID=G7WGI6_DESOD|nr:methionine ABC transporter permease [Desulfosporosinus orientis]AET68063.1 ABC-type metal ion transport system, permease component [Desulfosporosinus orientis DSM 765]